MDVLNIDGKKVKDIEFLMGFDDVSIDSTLIHECIVCYLNNQRQGNSSVKTRGEVSGGGNKPWKQKGTGRARSGSNRSPIWRHGGIVFGPQKRDYCYNLPYKKKKLGFLHSLLLRKNKNRILVFDSFIGHNIKKTRDMYNLLKILTIDSCNMKNLFVVKEKEKGFIMAIRNIPNLDYVYVDNMNVYDIMLHDNLIFDVDSIVYLNEKFKNKD